MATNRPVKRGRRRTAADNGDGSVRQTELLAIAGELFAKNGYVATTVRDIADAAGILSGSLYHHFESKEQIVDEILSAYLDSLLARYQETLDAGLGPRETLEGLIRESFDAVDQHRSAIAIYQNDGQYLSQFERLAYLPRAAKKFERILMATIQRGVDQGAFRSNLDVRFVYRFVRDDVFTAGRWYRPNGPLSARQVADQYLALLLDGLVNPAVRDARDSRRRANQP
jgi:AcrR family transcriptional regulator